MHHIWRVTRTTIDGTTTDSTSVRSDAQTTSATIHGADSEGTRGGPKAVVITHTSGAIFHDGGTDDFTVCRKWRRSTGCRLPNDGWIGCSRTLATDGSSSSADH